MRFSTLPSLILLFIIAAPFGQAQTDDGASESEQLKIAALEALVSAPAERALPLVSKVLAGNHSDEVKSRALFVLSQIELPQAQALLLDTARSGSGELRLEAIRMIGIGGDPDALAGLGELYDSGADDVRESVLNAYLIADDSNAVYQIAVNAGDEREFEAAVNLLGVMGAKDELRQLRDRGGDPASLVQAYAIADDVESLLELARDTSNPERQMQAIQGLGIVGGDQVNEALLEIYRGTDSADIKQSALQGMLVADYDEGVLELFQASQDAQEKQSLLRQLVIMDSDAVLDIIDATFEGDR